jgi:hypothetical protein
MMSYGTKFVISNVQYYIKCQFLKEEIKMIKLPIYID